MATVGTRNLTLADVSRRLSPDGTVDDVVELLNEQNEMLDDMTFVEANDGTTHKTTVRTGLPSGTWRKLYGGIQSTKSATAQVVDSCGMLEALPEIDVDVVDKSGDPAGTLLSEHTPHLEGLNQDVAQTLWYGDTEVNPERFMGLHQRYNVLSTDDTLSGYNVFSGGGTESANTSVWLINWGPTATHMIYPKGSTGGLKHENLGRDVVTAADGGKFLAYQSHYKWDVGCTVRDWRSVGRIANVDVGDLEAESSAADLIKLMIRCSERVQMTGGRPAWYMHERVRTMLRIQMLNHTNTNLTFETIEGRKVMMFDGIPIRISDQLLLTEAVIS